MKKIDLKKEYKDFYTAKSEAKIIDVPSFKYLMIDGKGNPNTSKEFSNAVELLYKISYTIKFAVKKGKMEIDYSVMPLEGLWWADDMNAFTADSKDDWKWTVMIMQPEFINEKLFEEAKSSVEKKKGLNCNAVRFEEIKESLSAQIMHLGPYSNEKGTIEKLHKFINENGYAFNGKHREIYLSDVRKTAPEKLKTILRQPIKKVV